MYSKCEYCGGEFREDSAHEWYGCEKSKDPEIKKRVRIKELEILTHDYRIKLNSLERELKTLKNL